MHLNSETVKLHDHKIHHYTLSYAHISSLNTKRRH